MQYISNVNEKYVYITYISFKFKMTDWALNIHKWMESGDRVSVMKNIQPG